MIQAYLAAMVLAILMMDVVRRIFIRQIPAKHAIAYIALVLGVCAVTMWLLGYFMVGGAVSSSGFGTYRMNLLSLIDPNGTGVEPDGTWSQLIPDQLGLGGDYEGYNYLGSGILCLILVPMYVRYKRIGLSVSVRGWALAIMSVGLFIYAISNRIAFGIMKY